MWHNVLTLFILIGWTLFSIYHIISFEPISKKTSKKFHLWTQYDFSVSDWATKRELYRIVWITHICSVAESRFSSGVALVPLYIYLLFVWFYKGQGTESPRVSEQQIRVQARSGPIHTKRKRKRSKNKRQFSLMLVCYSLICFACPLVFFAFVFVPTFAWCELVLTLLNAWIRLHYETLRDRTALPPRWRQSLCPHLHPARTATMHATMHAPLHNHTCPHNHAHTPSNHTCPLQPCTPPATTHVPHNHAHPQNHACPQQPHMPPATTHALLQPCMPPQPCTPPNHICPPATMHAPSQPCMPPCNHACPPATTHTPPPWTEWLTDRCKNITFANFVCGR